MNLLQFAFFWLIVSFCVQSCSSYTQQLAEIRGQYVGSRYSEALASLDKSDLKEQGRNQLLYQLEKAMILDRLGKTKQSQDTLLAADATVDRLYHASVAGAALSFVYNDSASDYQGEDYEKIAIHTMLALSYLGEGKLNEARVEARAINVRLTEINNFYEQNKNRYNDDAFARFLSGLIYESKREWDSAIIDYRDALNVYRGNYAKYFDTRVPDPLIEGLYRVAKIRNRSEILQELRDTYPSKKWPEVNENDSFVIGLHEVQTLTPKTAAEFVMIWDNKPVRFSFPRIIKKNRGVFHDSGIYIDGIYTSGDMSQNMDAIASETLEDSRLRYFAKMVSRLIIKDQIAQKARKQGGNLGGLIAAIYGAVTETADTRGWTFLPASFFITRAPIRPGEHVLRLMTNGKSSDFKKVAVNAGQFLFERDAG